MGVIVITDCSTVIINFMRTVQVGKRRRACARARGDYNSPHRRLLVTAGDTEDILPPQWRVHLPRHECGRHSPALRQTDS